MPECPDTIEEFQELERLLPLCKVTLYNQAKARIESGAAKSVSEAARQLADETARSVHTIRRNLNEAGTDRGDQLSEITGTSKHAPNPEPEKKSEWIKQTEKEILETAKQIKKDNTHNHRAQGTGENEWYTPQKYIDLAIGVLGGIDTDPASSELANEKVKADVFYGMNEDGLNKEWHGRVWLNPPYAQPAINNFAEKMAAEWVSGRIEAAIVLTHNYTDTKWFHTLAGVCDAVCFTRGRIAFENPEGEKAAPTQGQAFFYFGSDKQKFKDNFKEIGLVFFK